LWVYNFNQWLQWLEYITQIKLMNYNDDLPGGKQATKGDGCGRFPPRNVYLANMYIKIKVYFWVLKHTVKVLVFAVFF
jgi:hypothetical protein